MKKILLFTPRYPPQSGGSAIYFSNVVEQLSGSCIFIILTYTDSRKGYKETTENRVVYRIIPRFKNAPSIIRGLFESTVSLFFSLLSLIWGVDLFHVHAASYASPGLGVVSTLFRVPIIYDCRDEIFPKWLMKLGKNQVWFSCAENVDERLEKSGVNKSSIIRSPVINPPYVSDYRKRENNSCEFKVVFCGRLTKEKGVLDLIKGYEKFVQEVDNTTLVLVGDDPTGDVQKQVKNSSASHSIELTGELEHKDTLSVMSGADTLALPSESEAMPRVILEAFELGVPVIATPVGSIPDLISEEDNTGMLTEGTPEDIYRCLIELNNNESLREEISKNQINRIDQLSEDDLRDSILKGYDL